MSQIWDQLSLRKAISLQEELSRKITLLSCDEKSLKTAAGVDLAYWQQENEEYAVCCIVVLEQETKQVIEKKYSFGKITVPYLPGCLAFRELPLVLETARKLVSCIIDK